MATATGPYLLTSVSETVSYLTESTFDTMLDMSTLIETTKVDTEYEIYTMNTTTTSTTTSAPMISTTTTILPIIDAADNTTSTVYPSRMLGFTAACAFIIAVLGTIGKFIVFYFNLDTFFVSSQEQ